jgi:hypothetical protein
MAAMVETHVDMSESSVSKSFDGGVVHNDEMDGAHDPVENEDGALEGGDETLDTLKGLEESFQRNLSVGHHHRRAPPSRQRSAGGISSRNGISRGIQRAQSMRATESNGMNSSSTSTSTTRKAPSRRMPPGRTKSSDSLRPFRRDQVLVNASIADIGRGGGGASPLAGMAKAAAAMKANGGGGGGSSSSSHGAGGGDFEFSAHQRVPPRRMMSRSKSSDEVSVGSTYSDLDSCFTMDDSVMLRKTQLVADPLLDGASYVTDEISCAQHDDDDYSQATHFSEYMPSGLKTGQVVISGMSRHGRNRRMPQRLSGDDYDQAFDGASMCSGVSFDTSNSVDTSDEMMSALGDDGIGLEDDGLFDLTEDGEDFDLDLLPEEGEDEEESAAAPGKEKKSHHT